MSEGDAGEAKDGGRRRRRRRGRGGGGGGEQREPQQQQKQGNREQGTGNREREQQRRQPQPPRPTPTLAPTHTEPEHEHEEHAPAPQWGHDDDSPAKEVVLPDDLGPNPPEDDPDPVTWEQPGSQLGEDVAAVVGVRFVAAGRIQWCDAGDSDFRIGDRVLVDSERGQRVGTIATAITRRNVRDRSLRRVIRRAHDQDDRGGESAARELRIAKDVAAQLGLPLKVFRVEKASGKLFVYYTSDEQRLDVRDFVSDLARQTSARIELRQLGARDEAKQVGGIGSCGLTLCCTTWLPEFVPVSIKMAKDQGLVLSPTKVAGQCGRLKCCLVYEQAAYAEMRKGLPKLGKRVISARGEGRVVEVDVLRQRVRVSYAPGDSEVLPAGEVRPMFPSGNRPEPEPEPEPETDEHSE